jgi:4-carboxymuconolactone decarboxylase
MPRIRAITEKAELPEAQHAIFDSIAESRGRVGFPFSLLLNSPEAAGRIAHLGAFLRFDSKLANDERELAIITAARESDCAFEWAAHTRLARQAGVREEAIEAVANRAPVGGLTEVEALIVTYGRQLLRDKRVAQSTFDAAIARWGETGVVDLTALLGYYTLIACALNAFEVEAPAGASTLP